jgi:hypothetical protein
MFLSWALKPRATVCQWFGLKTSGPNFLVEPENQGQQFVNGLATKPLGRGSQFGPQNRQLRFGDLGLKITAIIFWFGP